MSRGHPRRRKKPRDRDGLPFQLNACRDQLLSRGIADYPMTAVARYALIKGPPESKPDLLLFLQEKYRRAIPVASQRAAAQSTSAVHSAAMTVTRHIVVYDNSISAVPDLSAITTIMLVCK